jgi:hypothetical protein
LADSSEEPMPEGIREIIPIARVILCKIFYVLIIRDITGNEALFYPLLQRGYMIGDAYYEIHDQP